ncbi:uncharacterized protein si:ch211-277c7.7 [Clinocottus analis]|uniref:uncharacterized protein si:ch211-277c7.7 n=1 Tax=Clinocottus analis TaxID=304258 RepID=UPI0035C0C537
MLPIKKVYVPCFSSKLGSSQRDESQPDQPSDQTTQTKSTSRYQRDGDPRGNRRANVDVRGGKKRLLLKVKLPKRNCTLSKKIDKTPRRWTGAATESGSVGGDVFCFSQRPTSTAINEKDKAKLSVLRTISKMMEENRLIRQRLATLSQAH